MDNPYRAESGEPNAAYWEGWNAALDEAKRVLEKKSAYYRRISDSIVRSGSNFAGSAVTLGQRYIDMSDAAQLDAAEVRSLKK